MNRVCGLGQAHRGWGDGYYLMAVFIVCALCIEQYNPNWYPPKEADGGVYVHFLVNMVCGLRYTHRRVMVVFMCTMQRTGCE